MWHKVTAVRQLENGTWRVQLESSSWYGAWELEWYSVPSLGLPGGGSSLIGRYARKM